MAQASQFDDVSVDDINDTYKKGYITAAQKNDIMRRKAENEVKKVIGEEGFIAAVMKQSVKNLQEGWENIKEGATESKGDLSLNTAKKAFQIMWGEIQVLTSAVNAVGTVAGAHAEMLALKAGASPGLAKVIGVAADVGTGIVPVGVATKSLVKGMKPIAQAVKGTAVAKTPQAIAAEAAEKAAGKAADNLIEETVKKGLQADGVKIAAKPAEGEKFFHGTWTPHKGFSKERGTFYITKDKSFAESFKRPEGELLEMNLKSGANVFDTTNPEHMKIAREIIEGSESMSYFGADDFIKKKFKDGLPMFAADELVDEVKKLGFDAIKLSERPGVSSVGVFNPDVVAVKSSQEKFTEALTKYRAEMKQITETKHHEVTLAEADKLGISLDDVRALTPGKALNEAEMAAHLKALDEPVNDLIDFAKRGLAGDDDALNQMGRMLADEFFEYSPKFRAAEVTAGRSVEILKETPPMKSLTDLLMGWNPEVIATGDFRTALVNMAEDITALADEPGKLKALQIMGATDNVTHGATKWEKIREGYVNLLLARPITQVRNFMGNVYSTATSGVERELGGWLSIDKQQGLVKGEGIEQFRGMFAGVADGLKGFADAYKTVDPGDLSKLDFIPHKIEGPLGRIINLPGDTMRGMDNFFKAVLKRGDYYAQARNMGVHQGLSGQALEDYVSRRVNMPTQAMMEHAKDFADFQTFANDLGTLGKSAQRIAQAGPLALYFPFMKTPMNLTKYVWNRAPGLQFLSKSLYDDIAEGGARADQAIGRLTLSNLVGMFWYGLAQQGVITGGGPADPTLRNSWLLDKQPNSIKAGSGWYPLTNLEPGTTPMALMADLAEIHNQLDEPTAGQAAMALGLAGVRDIVDKTYWRTLGTAIDFLGAVRVGQEPGKRALEVLAGPITAATTLGPAGAGVTRIFDPIRRETRTLLDDWRARVPGYSKELPPMRDMMGDPILPPQSIGHPWLSMISPITYKAEETDRVKLEASKLAVRAPKFPWALGGGRMADDFDVRAAHPGDALPVALSPQQRDRWQVIYKNILRSKDLGIEAKLLDTEEYKNSSDAAKRDAFMNYLAETRSFAQGALMSEDVELGKQVITNQAGKYLPLIQPEQRPAVEQQIERGVSTFEEQAPAARDNLMRWGVLEPESTGETE